MSSGVYPFLTISLTGIKLLIIFSILSMVSEEQPGMTCNMNPPLLNILLSSFTKTPSPTALGICSLAVK